LSIVVVHRHPISDTLRWTNYSVYEPCGHVFRKHRKILR